MCITLSRRQGRASRESLNGSFRRSSHRQMLSRSVDARCALTFDFRVVVFISVMTSLPKSMTHLRKCFAR
jgi:hypothetical protein